jgi:hypothetical protein
MAARKRLAGFWVVGRGAALMTEAASTCEGLENFYQTTRRHNPEASHFQATSKQQMPVTL